MWEYRTPPASNAFSELPATESARSFNAIGERDLSGIDRILELDSPTVGAGRRAEPVDRAASGADQGRADLPALEQCDDAIDGVAFGDPSEIQFHAGFVEARSSSTSGSAVTWVPPT